MNAHVRCLTIRLNKDEKWEHRESWKKLMVSNEEDGEGNGAPLQYSCLENPMDGGAWWAAVHGVVKSQTRLSDFTYTFHCHALEKEIATHSSVLACRIPGTGEPGGLPSMGSQSWIWLKQLSSSSSSSGWIWLKNVLCVKPNNYRTHSNIFYDSKMVQSS